MSIPISLLTCSDLSFTVASTNEELFTSKLKLEDSKGCVKFFMDLQGKQNQLIQAITEDFYNKNIFLRLFDNRKLDDILCNPSKLDKLIRKYTEISGSIRFFKTALVNNCSEYLERINAMLGVPPAVMQGISAQIPIQDQYELLAETVDQFVELLTQAKNNPGSCKLDSSVAVGIWAKVEQITKMPDTENYFRGLNPHSIQRATQANPGLKGFLQQLWQILRTIKPVRIR